MHFQICILSDAAELLSECSLYLMSLTRKSCIYEKQGQGRCSTLYKRQVSETEGLPHDPNVDCYIQSGFQKRKIQGFRANIWHTGT